MCLPARYSPRVLQTRQPVPPSVLRDPATDQARLSEGLAAGDRRRRYLGILIPPSITLILYGLASEQSIGRLFMAGIEPGILLVILFAFWVMFKYNMERKSAFAAVGAARHAIMEDDHFSWRDRLESLPRLLPS